MSYFEPLDTAIQRYLDQEQITKIREAFLFSEQAHQGQTRSTGHAYVTHPVAVATILAEMRMDSQTIMAALLHDVIEDTPVDKKKIATRFGESVAELVDGVSKLTQIKFESRAEAQAENFRKMVLAMAQDLRVIIIKLADRLHNMRTLGALTSDKRRRVALETLEIYAPIANRLGMHGIRIELEDLGFSALYSMRYRVLSEVVKKARGNRKEILSVIKKSLLDVLARQGITPIELSGREKHLYSIYKKMRTKRIPFSEIMDVYAFRVIVDSVDSCYRVLGVAHNLYKPVPERFKDYIAIPKSNGYQSLHTTLFGPYGVPIEIQIRTKEMDAIAESGIASHWWYKTNEIMVNQAHIRAQQWLKNLLEIQQSTHNSLEFIENVKIDLFPDEVYVFTPKGRILELPHGASVIDFAYAIHTDIGDSCVAAKINRRLAPLSMPLVNGQTVEIITSPSGRPNLAWLNFVVTGKARSSIKYYLKHQHQAESIALGRRLIERALETLNLSLNKIPRSNIKRVLKESNYTTLEDLLESTGLGNQSPLILARRLARVVKEENELEESEKELAIQALSKRPLLIKGTEGIPLTFATCCYPVPGDVILGIFDAGKGIIIHHEQCSRIAQARNTEKSISINWEENISGEFPVAISVELMDKRGVLAELAGAISEVNANIENIHVRKHDGRYCVVELLISVSDRDHLAHVMRRIRKISVASKITRIRAR
ncbi:MAG: bifunctional GTP diphosphokinase/guanosine-3',5'-bis pyrophosphate 3'-pyrophosphohydrolase [Legionellales bacterium]|nr:bifunctional GTP diphosphokinase/guanosine-3',5'-bis pyrophosphate 3'-pyrophosphohydrolase [Legionellales bacterium]